MKKILGIDYGERRIGIAISDSLKIIASPLLVLDRKKNYNYLDDIKNLIIEHDIGLIVVGLPLTLKGTISIQTEKTQDFIKELDLIVDVPIKTIDERLTSLEAEKILIQKGIKTGHNKSQIDQVSAIIILQEYLDTN
tara:strand:+ start:3098 stop:3508 length:411 start_codon:yes stop_codon:yes gene_type:complete